MKVQQGFTLIELMIVVGIIGIIAAIAYPSYVDQMRETRRSDAHAALLRMADQQERFYLQNNTYTANAASVGGAASQEGFYTLAVTAASVNGFTLTASAAGAQLSDTPCLQIVLTSAGQKTPAVCWTN